MVCYVPDFQASPQCYQGSGTDGCKWSHEVTHVASILKFGLALFVIFFLFVSFYMYRWRLRPFPRVQNKVVNVGHNNSLDNDMRWKELGGHWRVGQGWGGKLKAVNNQKMRSWREESRQMNTTTDPIRPGFRPVTIFLLAIVFLLPGGSFTPDSLARISQRARVVLTSRPVFPVWHLPPICTYRY